MKKSLLENNPYLKDTASREKALVRSVVSSSAIEGIQIIRDITTGRFVQANSVRSPDKATPSSQSHH